MTNILSVKNLKVNFTLPKPSIFEKVQTLKAVDDVSFELSEGQTLGVVGESGCGKSSLVKGLVALVDEVEGEVYWRGNRVNYKSNRAVADFRKNAQMIFQDPFDSLNPRMTVGQIISEPIVNYNPNISKKEIKVKVLKIMEDVGLNPLMINRYSHEFSGGQCQRIGIARAMSLEPKVLLCDEPVSALDVSIQAQVINLLKTLQRTKNVGMVFISHDLSVIAHVSDKVMVMYLGKLVEFADTLDIISKPLHPYTRALISAILEADPKIERSKKRIFLTGEIPSPLNPPSGCVFRTRCSYATDLCSQKIPVLENVDLPQTKSNKKQASSLRRIACHHYKEIAANKTLAKA